MKLYLSNIKNNSKPKIKDIKNISATMTSNLVDIGLEQFAEELTFMGKTTVLCELQEDKLSKTTPILQQQLVMLDFDNTKYNNYFTLEDLEKDEFILQNAVFYYTTFGHESAQVDKFRVVFCLDKPMTSNKDIEEIYNYLFKKYPQVDTAVGQTSRMFFGGNKGYTLINWGNVLDTKDIISNEVMVTETSMSGEIIDRNTPNYLLLKMGRVDLVQEKLGQNFAESFPDEYSAANYFKGLDMVNLLELPTETPFLDILHEESNPSANVFYAKEHDVYFYKCFSETNNFTGDICSLLNVYLGLKFKMDAVEVLVQMTNSNINASSKLGKQKKDTNLFRKELISGQLRTSKPELYRYLEKYTAEINITLDLMQDYTYMDIHTGEVRYLNYMSVPRLAKMVSEVTKKKVTEGKMWNILNVIIVTEMVSKLPQDKIPQDLYKQLIEPQIINDNKLRTSNIYEPNSFDSDGLANMDAIAKILLNNNITISSLSFELVYRLFGKEKANKDFPQSIAPLEDKGLLKMSKVDSNLTKKSVLLENTLVKIIMEDIETKGYIFEDKLIAKAAKSKNMKISSLKPHYVKIRSDIVSKYGLTRTRNNSQLQISLGVSEKYSTKTILYV